MDPISIAAGTLGAEFLKEAIKFLWSEASNILERYHKRREKGEDKGEEGDDVVDAPAPAKLELPARRTIRFDVVERRSAELKSSLKDLVLYAQGIEPVAASDPVLLEKADTLQRLIVETYGIDAPELTVTGRVEAGWVEQGGEAIGVEANVSEGDIRGEVIVKEGVAGRAVGAKVDSR